MSNYNIENYLDTKDIPELFKRTTYILRNICVTNQRLIEYDMKDAGLSIIREYKMLPASTIKYLSNLPSKLKHIEIGKICEKDDEFNKTFNDHFKNVRINFLLQNNLDDDKIISIKRDAIFLKSSRVRKTHFGEHIHFAIKNSYSSYVSTDTYELYYSAKKLDIKGYSNKTHILWSYLHELLRYKEVVSSEKYYQLLTEFRSQYVNLELPVECYRGIDSNQYVIKTKVLHIELDDITDELTENSPLYIMENYEKIILPFIRLTV